jgi:signal peptidase I
MLRIFKVTGNSLSPFFVTGDYVFLADLCFPFQNLTPGNIVVFDHPRFGRLIKKISSVDSELGTVEVEGTNPESITPEQIGPVQISDISGKVIFHIKRPGFG